MRIRSQLLVVLFMLAAHASPSQAQSDDFWRNKWFWGANAGAYLFSVGGTQEAALSAGGHWFITAGRSALMLGFEELFITGATTTLTSGRQVEFDRLQRVQASVYAMPSMSNLNIYLGGGFAIHNITDAVPIGEFSTPQQLATTEGQIEDLATKAFAVLGGGVQWRWRNRWVVYGLYQFMPSTDSFLITSEQHSFSGGLRFALTGAKEAVTSQR